ncbi:MAG: MFS transporter [Candidatus Sumerlaeota bacterium]|nr:MFS transporter [Candidatus Sumerlaeota bacterium]
MEKPWYREVTAYQWLVLVIASAGWVFDIYEGQVYAITRKQMLTTILGAGATPSAIKYYGDLLLSVFLLGGAVGGIFFGSLADKWGRRPTMVLSILVYSAFSGLTCFAQSMWQIAVLRFLVALGVGGEWAVAASLVAEVFPPRARTNASAIFHATSVFGTWLAALAGMAVGAQWRYAYALGVAPALLTVWVMARIREPEMWTQAEAAAETGKAAPAGSFRELFGDPRWRKRALLGMVLAAVGLGTFWGLTIAGQDLATEFLVRHGNSAEAAGERAKFAYGIVETTGGGLGLLMFGPLCGWLGRRRAFALIQLGALVIVPVTCFAPRSYGQLLVLLPLFGFFTLGMHAGFAVYFPELFPTRLRATGAGFCFNGGRVGTAVMMVFFGWLKARPNMDLRWAVTIIGLFFVVGLVTLLFLPETKGQPLPE